MLGLPPIGLTRQSSLVSSKLLLSQTDNEENVEVSFQRDFEDLGLIGSGTFSEVYLARDKNLSNELFAIKKSKRQFKSKKDRDLLLNEVKNMKKLGSSQYIIKLVKAWQENGFFYVQIDFAEKGTLEDLLCELSNKGEKVPDTSIWKICHDISCGLKHIHSFGLVHLDIKPANILIDSSGILKIGDFGMTTTQGTGSDSNEGDQR